MDLDSNDDFSIVNVVTADNHGGGVHAIREGGLRTKTTATERNKVFSKLASLPVGRENIGRFTEIIF